MTCKVLLVYPNNKGNYMLPPAIGILSAVLKNAGHEVKLFDTSYHNNFGNVLFDVDASKSDRLMTKPFEKTKEIDVSYDDPYGDFEKIFNSFNPDIIALSATEDMFPNGIGLLKRVQDRRKLTIVGGVFATYAPEIAILYPEIDIVCRGEGEDALLSLCNKVANGENFEDIPNLWIKKKDGRITKNAIKMVDFNKNPLIDVSLFEEARYYRPMTGKIYRMFPVETFRGCPFKCGYCNSPSIMKIHREEINANFLRRKSFDKIFEEISFYKNTMKAEYLYFWADTFFSWKGKDFDRFCEMYKDINLPFWCQTRPENMNYETAKKLKDIGCHRISFGVEHGNEAFRKKVLNRNVKNTKIIDGLKTANEVGISFSVNNIIGFPHETYELAFDTIELNRKFHADGRNAYPYTPFHGTPLRDECERLGFVKPEDLVYSFVAIGSLLDMPQFSKKAIDGLSKTFNLYVKFPKSRWPEIKKAESNSPEGLEIYSKLKQEYIETYM